MNSSWVPAVFALALLPAAQAETQPPVVTLAAPSGVLNLTASASIEVQKDLMSVTLSATREGADATTVQAGLKQAIESALGEARKQVRPGQLEVRSGGFSVYPRYGDKGRITGWQGTASIVLEGRDMPAIAQLAGRLQTVVVTGLGYGLSREARERVEGDVTAQAIARYKARAAEVSRQFGYGNYTIREVSVSGGESAPPVVGMTLMRAQAKFAADEPLPTEPGKETVTATVSGTVQMTAH